MSSPGSFSGQSRQSGQIAEGYGRHGGKEYEHFLQIAYGSASEADNWFTVLLDASLLEAKIALDLQARNEEVLRMLVTMLRILRTKRRNPGDSLKESPELYDIRDLGEGGE